MDHTDRIVVTLRRIDRERRVSLSQLHQLEIHQRRQRRSRQFTRNYLLQELRTRHPAPSFRQLLWIFPANRERALFVRHSTVSPVNTSSCGPPKTKCSTVTGQPA